MANEWQLVTEIVPEGVVPSTLMFRHDTASRKLTFKGDNCPLVLVRPRWANRVPLIFTTRGLVDAGSELSRSRWVPYACINPIFVWESFEGVRFCCINQGVTVEHLRCGRLEMILLLV